jgi:hypothetical protein
MMADDRENAYKMLGILQSYAPTGKEQQQLADIYNGCLADGHRRTVQVFAGILHTGLTYGNWPWTSSRVC